MDASVLKYLSNKDSIFTTIINTYGIPKIPQRPQGFQTLVLLILEQQVSIDSAKATFNKLKLKITDFNPNALLNLPEHEYRACGVSRQKTAYIKGLSSSITEKTINLESLSNKSSEEVRSELIKIKGIGNWTIDVYLMFALQEQDIIPLGDIAVINTIKELLQIQDKSEIEKYTQKWAPYRSFATFLLWHYYLEKRGRKISY
jgi:DNA-3-methyladenine glycosylase II